MNRVKFNLRNVAIIACLAATAMFFACDPEEDAKDDSAAYWKQWESSMSAQGYPIPSLSIPAYAGFFTLRNENTCICIYEGNFSLPTFAASIQ
jgi:hypothetical protein